MMPFLCNCFATVLHRTQLTSKSPILRQRLLLLGLSHRRSSNQFQVPVLAPEKEVGPHSLLHWDCLRSAVGPTKSLCPGPATGSMCWTVADAIQAQDNV
eukprot:g47461.t1